MDLRRLEAFCKVVELKSFTKAAEEIYLSQPTVSEHIRTLEESIGEKLLDRLGREVLPTPAGKILYRYARKMLREHDEALQAIRKFRGELSGHFIIGASTIPGTYILPALIGSFKVSYPSVDITVRISGSHLIAEEVVKGGMELGIVGALWNDPSLEWKEGFSDELVVAVPPDHPWTLHDSVTLEEMAGEPFILRERDSGTRKVMEHILKEHGFDPSRLRVVAEIGSTEAVKQCVKERVGVSIVSGRALAGDLARDDLASVPVEGIRFRRSFFFVTRKKRQLSPVCSTFLDHLLRESRQ